MRNCKICKKEIRGRSDKIFCSTPCKNQYHIRLRAATAIASKKIDRILHRNRSILLEIIGKNTFQKKIPRILLEQKNFRFNYLTHFYKNKAGKTYHWVYDHAWVSFSSDEILIVKKER